MEPNSCRRRPTYRLQTRNLSYNFTTQYDDLKWVNLFSFNSRNKSQKKRFVLQDVNCEARPGEITAIAGPSGAGKTTLLEILAGKSPPGVISGVVLVNNYPINCKIFRKISGYVTQDEALFPLLTVEETLTYSALLRLNGGKDEKKTRVRMLIKELKLDHISDSKIGEGSNNGISGGERRRVSIGVELVNDPPIILIDEPTSGLDSGSALQVILLLKSMAITQEKTVVLTIHQPGFRILELFDRIVLLSNGGVVHNGSMKSLEERLKYSGFQIPRSVNVLEFSIDVTERLIISSIEQPHDHRIRKTISGKMEEKLFSYPNSQYQEVLILGQRFCKNVFRTKQLFATRVVQALVAGLVLGTIFVNSGKNQERVALQTRIGFFAFTLTFLLSSTTEGLPIFLQERRILLRETSRGAYRVSSYVLANTLVFIPFLLMIGVLYASSVYWLVGLRRNSIDAYLYFSLVVWMVVLMSNSFTACFSALVPNFIMGTSVIAGLMGSFFLFSGYFISKEKIPNYWIFMHYLSLFKYPFECFLVNEYGGEYGRRKCVDMGSNGVCNLFGDGFLRQQGIKESQKWSNLAVMLGFILGYRLLSFPILCYRCYKIRK